MSVADGTALSRESVLILLVEAEVRSMAQHRDFAEALDVRCRDAVRTHRMDAFDNVDVARLLGKDRLSVEDARWIGRHLMENGRAPTAYREGQAILGATAAEASRAGRSDQR